MKMSFVFVALLAAGPAFAVNDAEVNLVCWDAKSERGSKPMMKFTAHYNSKSPQGATLAEIQFPSDDEAYEYLPRAIRDIFHGAEITTRRSPYYGNYEYELMDGLRFVLTKNVSPDAIEQADVDGRGRGHAGVLDIDQKIHKKWSGGNYYIRVRCRVQ